MQRLLKYKLLLTATILMTLLSVIVVSPSVSAATPCGEGDSMYTPSVEIGCTNKGNAITDATFGIIRFLTNGVGLVLIGSLVYAGIQYAASRGDPQATASAIKRIESTVIALLIFIFSYAILNYVLPSGFLQ